MSEPLYITPGPRMRLLALAKLLAPAAVVMPFLYGLRWFPLPPCATLCDSLPLARYVLVGGTVLGLLGAGLLARRARAILRSGQTPPPGTWMLFRTKVSTGASAKIDAWFGYAAGATLLAGVAWLLALYLSSGDVALMVLGLRECR